MNVVDSSAWLEYFADGPNAAFFADAIEEVDELVVPSLTLFEVFKRVAQQRDEHNAIEALAVMHQGEIVDLSSNLALVAAQLSLTHKLAMADSIILATAQAFDATLWTQDADFRDFDGVQFQEHR